LDIDNPPAWLSELSIVLYAIFIPIIWQYASFIILIYYATLKNILKSLVEESKIDGEYPIKIEFNIRDQLIMNIFKVDIMLYIVGTNGASEVMASYMYKLAFANHDFGYGSAIGFLLLIITLIVTVFIRKLTATNEELQY